MSFANYIYTPNTGTAYHCRCYSCMLSTETVIGVAVDTVIGVAFATLMGAGVALAFFKPGLEDKMVSAETVIGVAVDTVIGVAFATLMGAGVYVYWRNKL